MCSFAVSLRCCPHAEQTASGATATFPATYIILQRRHSRVGAGSLTMLVRVHALLCAVGVLCGVAAPAVLVLAFGFSFPDNSNLVCCYCWVVHQLFPLLYLHWHCRYGAAALLDTIASCTSLVRVGWLPPTPPALAPLCTAKCHQPRASSTSVKWIVYLFPPPFTHRRTHRLALHCVPWSLPPLLPLRGYSASSSCLHALLQCIPGVPRSALHQRAANAGRSAITIARCRRAPSAS